MPVINNGSQHDRIRKLQARTIYAAYLTDKAAVDDKVLVQSSLNPQTSSDFTSMKEGAFYFTPEELDAVLQNNATTSPVTVPDAPTIVSAVGGNGQATVSWTVPANNGGSQIIDYTVLSTPGSLTLTVTGASTSTAVITGLTNGTAYTFTITARNSVGNSTPSSASSPVTPNPSVPDAPLISGTTTPTTTSITFAFTPPTNDGGSAILDYSILGVTLNSSAVGFTIGSTNYTSSQIVTGLSPGQIIISGLDYSTSSTTNTYIISLIARNIMGNSSPLTITQATATATTPATGSAGTGSAGLGGGTTVATTSTLTTITFSFVASSDTGGLPITDYTLGLALGSSAVPFTIGSTNYSAGQTVTIASPGTITISGLDYSTLITTKTYNISITTNNAIGSSSPLTITKATATALVADAPTLSGTTTSTLQTITFSFAQTVATGNQLSVSNYTLEVSLNSSAVPFTIGSTNYSAGQSATINSPGTITISGLEYSTSGTTKSYNLSLVANNPVGASPPLTITKATGTAYLPNAPGLSGTTTFTGTSITFTFADGPALGGALPVLDHILSYSSSSPTVSSPTFIVNSTTYTSSQSVTGISEGTVVISGLQNSTTYTFNLYTRNSLGNSSPLAITQATAYPPDPPILIGTTTSTGMTITFTFDDATLLPGALPILDHVLTYSSSSPTVSSPTFTVYSSTYTSSDSATGISTGQVEISGLEPATTYTFNLYATNEAGNSSPLTITQSTKIYLTGFGSPNTYIAKYDSSGTPQWANSITGNVQEKPVITLSDSAGNVYVAGIFAAPTLRIGALTPLTNSGGFSMTDDTFIAKYNSSGVAQWAKKIGGAGPSGDRPVDMVLDATGNVYVSGTFASNITIDTLPTLTTDSVAIYIVKYNSSGEAQWAKKINGTGTGIESPRSMVLDTGGNLYVYGTFNSPTLTIDTLSPLTNSGTYDNFIVKYNFSGDAQWVKSIAGTGNDVPVNMVLDSSANIYISGYFNSPTLTIDTFSLTRVDTSGNDVFIVKYDSSGDAQWAESITGNGDNIPLNMSLDSTGNLYVSGQFISPSLTIGSLTPLTNSGNNDIFIVKYNSSGVAQWAKKIGGTVDDRPGNMVLDATGNVYLSGRYASSSLTIGLLSPLTNSGNNDIFIVKYNSSGDAQWVESIAGTGSDEPVNMVLDTTGNIYVSGYFASPTLTIDTFSLTRFGGNDTFIVKYNSSGDAQWVKSIGGTGNDQPVNMVLDTTGNICISGNYTAPITFM